MNDSAVRAAYRPHLDGLRALAVYLVVLFHAGSSLFSAGYIGVDVFFVLSGFLVTQLLLRDIAGSGSIRLGRFYARRFRRLLPAAFVALLVTAAVFAAIASPSEVAEAVGSFKAAFLYSTNWYFIHQSTGYFGADISANPVLHYWSLAVEEQFYLLWPLALGGAFTLTRSWDRPRQMRAIRIGVAAGALASAVWALSLRTGNPNRAYYGTDTRAYELLVGALIALIPAWVAAVARYRRLVLTATVVSLGVLIALASSWFDLDGIERGIAVTLATAVLIVGLEAVMGGVVKRVLSQSSVVYLGKISYGTYLWHWPVILVVVNAFHVSTIATIGIALLVATALASLSFEVLERPVRTSSLLDRHRRVVIASGLALSALSAFVFIPSIVDPAKATAPVARGSTTSGFTPVPASLDWRTAKRGGTFIECLDEPVDACTVVHGTGRHILLIGDSHAWMLIPALTEVARRENATLSVSARGGCPWQRELFVFPITVNGRTLRTEDCEAHQDDTYTRVIPELHPDVIVAMTVAHEDRRLTPFLGPDRKVMRHGTPAYYRWLESKTTQAVDALRADGAKLVILEPIPVAPSDPLTCISKATVLEQCRYVASAKPDPLERFYRQIAAQDDDVFSADLDRLVCPFLPICDPVVNGQIVKQDATHLTSRFARSIAPGIDMYLRNSGLMPR